MRTEFNFLIFITAHTKLRCIWDLTRTSPTTETGKRQFLISCFGALSNVRKWIIDFRVFRLFWLADTTEKSERGILAGKDDVMQPCRLFSVIVDVLFCYRELYFCLERPKEKERSHTLPWQQTDQAPGGQPGWRWYHADGKPTRGVQLYFVFRPHFPLLAVKA